MNHTRARLLGITIACGTALAWCSPVAATSLRPAQAALVVGASFSLNRESDPDRAFELLHAALVLGTRGGDSSDGAGSTIPWRELALADWLERRGEPLEALAALWEHHARSTDDDFGGDREQISGRILAHFDGTVPEAVPLHRAFVSADGQRDGWAVLVAHQGGAVQTEEVSVAQWRAAMGWVRVCQGLDERPESPVACIDAFDALHFANEVSLLGGLRPVYGVSRSGIVAFDDADGYRLPTTSEWQAVAGPAAGSVRNRDICGSANILDRSARPVARALRQRPFPCADGEGALLPVSGASMVSAVNLVGNVAEWVWRPEPAVVGRSWRDGRASLLVRPESPNNWSTGIGVRLWRSTEH